MFRKLFFITVLFICFFFHPKTTNAATNFTTDYSVTYTVSEDGQTRAQMNGTLTNATSQYYASQYKIQLGFDNISNVKASDSDGAISPKVTKVDDGFIIELNFNKKAVGLGSKLPFSISFETPTIAKRFGKVLEINIPGVSNANDFKSFTVKVAVPPSFGDAAYIKPNQGNNSLTFTKEQLGKSGISIAFGQEQLYSFHLTYHLRNENVYPIRTEIALPPSTNYQDVYINEINPRPINVIEDADGNWLAQYRLLPAQKMDIAVSGVAQINLQPKEQPISESEIAEYTKERQYWEIRSPEVKALAKELKTPHAIYDYVVKALKYDFTRVSDDKPRLGGLEALKNPNSAVCREFTDLFITIARAAGIPAREVDGFAYTENTKQRPLSLVRDILHAWPEYYDKDKKTWVMVDPTWGSTTGGVDYFSVLDLDHFAFVIKGVESDYPIPAGGYKFLEGKNVKDLRVDFADSLPVTRLDASITTSFPKISTAGLPISGKVTLVNTGTKEITPQVLAVSSSKLLPHDQMLTVNSIPPFGSQTWDISFKPTSLLTNAQAAFTIHFAPGSELGEKTSSKTLKIAPFFLTPWGIGGITLGILTLIVFIIARKFRSIRLFKR